MSNTIRTKEQLRAEFALEVIGNEAIKILSKDEAKKFVNFCAGVPNMILQNGFGQTFAFLAAKGGFKDKDKHTIILKAVLKWLNKKESGKFLTSGDDLQGNLKRLSEMSIQDYLAAQREALALLEWIKRYAKAFVKTEED